MVARLVGAALGLLAFAISVLAGLYVRNPVSVILSRSILALFGFFLIGLLIGAAAQRVVDEFAKTREADIRKQYSREAQSPLADAAAGGPATE